MLGDLHRVVIVLKTNGQIDLCLCHAALTLRI